jgi:hypothetical protein
MDRKQRNFLLLCGGIVLAYYVERSCEESARQAAYYRQMAIRAAQQRARAKATPAPPPRASSTGAGHGAPAPSPAGAATQSGPLSGVWQGRTAITGRGLCTLRIELHENEPGHFQGYSTLACTNYGPLMAPEGRGNAAGTLNRMNPAEAILSGAMEDGSLRFHVDNTIGTNSNGCGATSFTLTPFGTNQLAAQWEETGCQGGHVILQKARR